MSRDARCVFVAYDPKVADVVVAALGGHGIDARAMGSETLSSILGFAPWPSPSNRNGGIEVWVANEEDASLARQILAELQENKPSADDD